MRRRTFCGTAVSWAVAGWAYAADLLEPWKPGNLDIHHLAYGRGNATFVLGPDGTTMLIDAGTNEDSLDVSVAQKPNVDVRPGEWIADYCLRQMRAAGREELDYFLLTHLHPDHVGDVGPENPRSAKGNFRLTGVMDVGARLPIVKVIDRGFPDYAYPVPVQAPFALNYLEYVQSRVRRGEACERFAVGRADQIRLMHEPARYPGFVVRNLAANGDVWTGTNEGTRHLFPELGTLAKDDFPTENMCSIAIRMSYGKFDYFTGGDLTCDIEETGEAWRDVETPVAQAAGAVEVVVADHHGYFDAVGPEFVRALRPRVFVVPAWYVAHPTIEPLRRMLSRRLYPGERDVLTTNLMPANRMVNNQFVGKLKSVEGHVVVRVAPGGERFEVLVCDNTDDTGRVKARFGPYVCD